MAESVRPSEWALHDSNLAEPVALIRETRMRGSHEPYWRVTTGQDDRTHRRLIGYWGTFEDAEHNARAWWSQVKPEPWRGLSDGRSFHEPLRSTPQKPPPQPNPGDHDQSYGRDNGRRQSHDAHRSGTRRV